MSLMIRKHSSKPYNPEIANAFFRSGEIEIWGRGIERIVEECHAAGFPDPVVKYDSGDWWTEFTYPETVLKRLTGESKTPEKTPEKILSVLKDHPNYSLADVAAVIGKSQRAVERASVKLVN